MRTGLFLSALLATALVGSTALADRNNDNDNKSTSHARDIKERVLEKQKEGFGHSQRTESTKNDTAAQKKFEAKTSHHAQGDNYEQYGKTSSARSTTTTSSSSSKITKQADRFSKRGGETMSDSKGKTSSRSNMGTQVGWSAGGKSVRSYVHFVNDKGQVNNNIRGNTATAMKARHVANVLLRTAGIKGKLFNWQGSGGDASESLF
jgi:Ni/Co efflux regulator RcnB